MTVVVLFHAFPARMPGGFVGVDIFFVISGYLISRIIFTELATGHFSFIEFYSRRIRRIFPALLLVLVTCCVVGWLVLLADEYAQLGKHVAAGAGFVQNLVLWAESGYFDQTAELKPLLHLWSLGIEEQFYIVWPLILWLLFRIKCNCVVALALLTSGSLLLCLVATQTNLTAAFYSPLTRFWELLLGAVLAWQSSHSIERALLGPQRLINNCLSIFGLMLIVFALLLLNKGREFPGFWALLPTLGASLLIYAGPEAVVNRIVLSNRAMVLIGLISYPLYLWHWPVLSFARVLENQALSGWLRAVLVGVSVILAWGTYALLERPIRLRFSKNVATVWTLALLMSVVGGFGYWVYRHDGVQTREVVIASTSTAELIRMDAPPQTPCISSSALSAGVSLTALKLCTLYKPVNSVKTIVLWGDSSVISWSPVFLTIAHQKNYTVIAITHPSCPPIFKARKTAFTFEASKSYCADGSVQSEIVQLIKNSQPDLIVWMAAWSAYANREFITDLNGVPANLDSTQRVLSEGIPKTLSALTDISSVVVMQDWPIMPSRPSFRSISLFGYTQQPLALPRRDFDRSTAFINQVFSTLTNERVRFFNPATKICDGTTCQSLRNGVLYYEDTYHMLPQATMRFRDEIEKLLDAP